MTQGFSSGRGWPTLGQGRSEGGQFAPGPQLKGAPHKKRMIMQ